MDQDRVFAACFMLELADGLQERLALDIAYRAADLDDGDMHILGCVVPVETALDLVGNMRDDLDGASAVISAPLFLQDAPVNLSRGDVGVFIQVLVDKTLVVSQIQICLGAVVGDEDFSVLDRIHGARIDVDIRIEFLHGDLIAARFQKAAQRGCGDAFSKTRYDASGDKYIFYWHGNISFLSL